MYGSVMLGACMAIATGMVLANASCGPSGNYTLDPPNLDRNGGDYAGRPLAVGTNDTAECCAALCNADSRCVAFSWNNPEPTNFGACLAGAPCCHLKDASHRLTNNTWGRGIVTGVLHRPPTPPPAPTAPAPTQPWPAPAYPQSEFITNATFDWAGTIATGVEGDTWPSTTLANGSSFAMGCDNHPPGEQMAWMNWWSVADTPPHPVAAQSGVPTGSRADAGIKLTLLNNAPVTNPAVAAICHKYNNFTANASGFGEGNIKPSSVIAIGNVLIAGVQCMTYDDHASPRFVGRQRAWNAWLVTSTDGGVSWNVSATSADMFLANLTNPMFIQNSPGFSDAPDGYVYVHFPAAADPDTAYWDGNDFILLGRVPRAGVLDRSAYEFWTGWPSGSDRGAAADGNQQGSPRGGGWTADATQAVPVFEYRHMTGQDHSFYSVGLKRYILPNYGFVDPHTGQAVAWHGLHDQHAGIPYAQLTLFESLTPWGPWSLFYSEDPWNLNGRFGAYDPDFPMQWQSPDGRRLRMVSSACCGQPEYSYHATELTLTLSSQPL